MTIYKNITPFNRWEGRAGNKVEWIVLHYTANVGDTAKGNAQYFASQYLGASAHFFVDENEIWQSVALDDTAWHCGDNPPSRNGCTNRNSIGIEMCTSWRDGSYFIKDKVVDNTAALVLELLEAFPEAKLCRHYDVTGKICPQPWVNDPSLWEDFKKRVEENRPMTPAERKEFDALKKKVDALEGRTSKCEKTDAAQDRDIAMIDERTDAKYNTIKQCPAWAKPTVTKLVNEGYLKGDGTGLALTEDLTRTLVIVDRAGGFDK